MKRECYVIAEAGSCHDASLEHAKALIDIAVEADANAVKFQYWSDSLALATRRHDVTLYEQYEPYRMPAEWLPVLAEMAHVYHLDFLCTVYMPQDIPTIAPFVDKFKVASFDALDGAFLEAHRPYDKTIIMSVGMLTDIEVGSINLEGIGSLLHCVSSYPCPMEQVNLGAIRANRLNGFSDHTGHPMMGAWAYLAGANIIETHVRGDFTKPDNPDYPHALSPLLLRTYIANIREVELAWGDGIKHTMPAEAANRKYMA